MRVVIDGQPAEGFSAEGSVTDAAMEIIEAQRQLGRAVVGISINGNEMTPDSLQDRCADVEARDANIEVSTRPLLELVLESLDQLGETLPELPEACRKLAQVFQSELPDEGYEPFNELARIWDFVKDRQQMVANVLGIELGAIEVQGLSVAEHLRELNNFLVEAAQALRDGDTVLLGDLLEYELAPRAELEAELVAELRARAEAAAQ